MGLTKKGQTVAEAVASRANISSIQSATMSYAMGRAAGIAGGSGAVAATEATIQATGKDKTPTPPSRTMQEAWMGYSMGRAVGIAGGVSAVEASQAAIVHSAAKAEGVVGKPVGYTWLMPPPTVAERAATVAQPASIVYVAETTLPPGTPSQSGDAAISEAGGTPVDEIIERLGGSGGADEDGLFTQRNLLIGGAAIAGIIGLAALSRRKK